uniref:Uncharacterized protein n=1 Tax=Romanomermis culicivorax TaxID=13658 RepID=A0A915JIW5_ROMCU
MEEALLNGTMFGFAKVDISTPKCLKEEYADFPPIIKHADISIDDIGEHMKEYAYTTGQLKKSHKNLVSSYFGKEIMFSTPMICFLVKQGLKLIRIQKAIQYDEEQAIQYDEERPFEGFRDKVTQHRREGDTNPDLAMLADTYKLLGNTGYGKTLTNKEGHIDVYYYDTRQVTEASYSVYLKRAKLVKENSYEVPTPKNKIVLTLTIVVGLSVYNWTKIEMLEFFHDILPVNFNKSMYQCREEDTDSIHLAISSNDLLDAVKPECKEEFMQNIYPKWFVTWKENKQTPK